MTDLIKISQIECQKYIQILSDFLYNNLTKIKLTLMVCSSCGLSPSPYKSPCSH